jgi:predicted MFS family arabinose efflux permease
LIAAFTLFWLGVGAAGLGLAPNYWVALPAMAGIGLMLTPLNASLQTIMQQGVPAAKLGRASAVVDMGISLAHLSSMGGAGWVAGLIGLRQTYLVGGFLIGLGALAFLYLLRGVETAHHERVIGVQAAEPVA